MSEIDDDLLNDEEFDYEDYDITNEKEDALLQDEESNHLPEHEDHEDHSDKKESEDDNEEDVLDLDYEAEEELEDVEDKPAVKQSSEQRQYRKFASENEKPSSSSSDNSNNTAQKVISPQIVKKNIPSNNNKQVPPTSKKPNNIKKALPKYERRRGGGGGRGNFQNRSNFTRNNNTQKGRQERRNGKVYINPKYEGIVPVNESNGRLAWDNSNFAPASNAQNIQPWLANATLEFNLHPGTLFNNLVSNLANHSAIQIQQQQPQIQNSFEPPQQVPQVFQNNNLTFQPPPTIAPIQTYSSQNQVSGRQPFPSQMPALLPTPQRFSNQPVNRMQEGPKPFNSYSDTSNYYDRPNNQQTYLQDLKKDYPPTNFESRNTSNMTGYSKTAINNNKSDWYDYGSSRTDTFKTDSFSNSGYSEPNDFSLKVPSYGSNFQRKNNYPPKTAYSSTYTNDYATKSSLYGNDTSYQSKYQLPPTDLFAKSYTAGKVEDHNKNLNPTLKTGDNNRGPMTYASSKLGDNRSNQSLYNAPRKQNISSNDYSKRTNYSNLDYNNSTKLQNYQSLSYDNKPNDPKPSYSSYNNSARPDQDQRYNPRKEELKPNYDNRNDCYGNRNYTRQDDYMKESSNSLNFKNNWSQNKNYNRNVQNSSLPNNRRAIQNEISDIKVELPIKKMKSSEEQTAKNIEIKVEATPTDNKIIAMEEEEDEETRLYRLKIEEQKKQRERILKLKEERRKLALQEAKNEEMAAQKLENKPQDLLKTAPIAPIIIPNNQKRSVQQQINNNPVLSAKSSSDKLSLTFNVQNDLQTNAETSQKSESSSFMSNRVVLVKNSQKGVSSTNSSSNVVVKTVPVIESGNETNDVGQNISSFFNNRKVLKKDSNLINTRLVVVNNLSASTSENKLVSMAKGIGEIQKLRMDRQERQATILFKTVASAHAFFKKYQRHMLDLSMIEVRLENML